MTEKRNSFYLNIISQSFQMKKLKNSLLNFFRETHAQIQKEEKKERRQNNGVFFWFNSIKM